jgi:hypothetical protein
MRLLGLVRPGVARLLRTAQPYTLMSARNLTTLYREGQRTLRNGVVGDFVEIGVHRGGSAGILAALIKQREDRHLHLFDRWGDLPEPTERDGFRQQEYRKDKIADKLAHLRDDPPLDRTRHLLETLMEFPPERLHYYPGWYSETFAEYPGTPIAFASLDCDYYESVRDALEFIDQYGSPSATIVADDYGSWPGVRAAIDEWVAKSRRRVWVHPLRTGPALLRLGTG